MVDQTWDPELAVLPDRASRLRNALRAAQVQTEISRDSSRSLIEASRALITATRGLVETSQLEIVAARHLLRHKPRR